MNDILPSYYTVAEVAKLLRIGRRQAYDLVAAGEIPNIKVGSSIRIPRIKFEEKFGLAA